MFSFKAIYILTPPLAQDEKSYGLLLGLAPVGVDTKGAPALLPARIKLAYEKDEAKAKAVLAAEAAVPSREQRHALDPAGAYSAAQPFWAHIAGARWGCGCWRWECPCGRQGPDGCCGDWVALCTGGGAFW